MTITRQLRLYGNHKIKYYVTQSMVYMVMTTNYRNLWNFIKILLTFIIYFTNAWQFVILNIFRTQNPFDFVKNCKIIIAKNKIWKQSQILMENIILFLMNILLYQFFFTFQVVKFTNVRQYALVIYYSFKG